ncbi:MAG: hypothetical protein QMC81_03650 [Thermoanaerobacterales bacterium]|nr:hypothetical protein [Bacillota bacterium]MDI6906575.1 hypothetical protein [Thermoanaerobacterales bacterium]
MTGRLAVYLLALAFVSPVFIGALWLKAYLIEASGGTLPTRAADLVLYFMLGAMVLGTIGGIIAQGIRRDYKKQSAAEEEKDRL